MRKSLILFLIFLATLIFAALTENKINGTALDADTVAITTNNK